MSNILEEINKNCKGCDICGDKCIDGGLCLNCEEGMEDY